MRHVISIVPDTEDGGVLYKCSCGRDFSFAPPALKHARRENEKQVSLEREEASSSETSP